jgi:hypothetical protein
MARPIAESEPESKETSTVACTMGIIQTSLTGNNDKRGERGHLMVTKTCKKGVASAHHWLLERWLSL